MPVAAILIHLVCEGRRSRGDPEPAPLLRVSPQTVRKQKGEREGREGGEEEGRQEQAGGVCWGGGGA